MTRSKYLFIGLLLIIIGILTFLGHNYYFSRNTVQKAAYNRTNDSSGIKTQETTSPANVPVLQPVTKSASSEIIKDIRAKQDYQPTETENLFYNQVIDSVKPKPNQMTVGKITVYDIAWNRDIYKAFPYRRPYSGGGGGERRKTDIPDDPNLSPEEAQKKIEEFKEKIKRYYASAYDSGRFYQDMITNLGELVRQFPNSPFHLQYEEDISLIIQMQKEDESFYDKYDIDDVTNLAYRSDIRYHGTHNSPPLEERIIAYIHCLRYSYFYKSGERYTMEFENHSMMQGIIPNTEHILAGARLVEAGAPAVPAVLNILEDHRPIVAVDEDKIPSRFYRYQDAAVEILQRMFSKSQTSFPVELSQGEYFSEYLEKQTPENKQKIISDIKAWVEEALANPPKQEETPPGTDDAK